VYSMHLHRFYSLRQLFNHPKDGPTELIRSPSLRSAVEGFAYNRLALTGRKSTLIIVRIMLTDPKAAFVCVMPNASFARFVASMTAFKEERVPSRRFGRRDLASTVETRDDYGVQAARIDPDPSRDRRSSSHDTPRADRPIR